MRCWDLRFFFGGVSQASAESSDDGAKRVVPVLVKVNKKGDVTRIDPALHLRPVMTRALEQTVKGMIHKPAMKDGKPIASQFVLNLAIVSAGQKTNEYKFSYVSAQEVPPGNWHWTLKNSHGKQVYALQSDMGPGSPGINVEVPPDYRAVPVPIYPKGRN